LNEGDTHVRAEHYEEAIRLRPNDATAYNAKGLALEALGKKQEAQQAHERARQLGYSS